MRLPVLIVLLCTAAYSEIHTFTARQSLDQALRQNPDLLIARLDEQRALAAARVAREPFALKLFGGSGLAYTSGFPMSIEGSAPSIFQTRAVQTLYNRPLSYQVAATRENARGAMIDTEARREEVAHRVLSMHLAAARANRVLDLLRQQVASFESIAGSVRARVEEGRDLPVEGRAAELRLAQTRQRLAVLEADRDQRETALALVLGFGPEDRVRPAEEEFRGGEVPSGEDNAIEAALASSKQVRRLESALHAKQLEYNGHRSSRWPQVDLVAQYAVMARFNNFEEFFRRFQRHNWQLGMSFQIPIVPSAGAAAQATQAELEMMRLRTQITTLRNQITADTRKLYQDLQNAESAAEVARMDLDVTRERLSVALAQFEEGRSALRQVEELRTLESEKWLAFFDARHQVEQARLQILHQTGTILAFSK
jgi:outer membrane protein